MPRTSRTVAQRLATQSKNRKRRPQRQSAPVAPSPEVERILDEAVPGDDAASTIVLEPVAPRSTASTRRPAAKPATTRRRYAEYGAEYRYVWSDLRRIALVAGGLLLLLIVLSLFIR